MHEANARRSFQLFKNTHRYFDNFALLIFVCMTVFKTLIRFRNISVILFFLQTLGLVAQEYPLDQKSPQSAVFKHFYYLQDDHFQPGGILTQHRRDGTGGYTPGLLHHRHSFWTLHRCWWTRATGHQRRSPTSALIRLMSRQTARAGTQHLVVVVLAAVSAQCHGSGGGVAMAM